MLKRTSGGDSDTELNELTVAPIRAPSFVTVVTTATPVGKSPRASRKLRSVKVIWRALFVASRTRQCLSSCLVRARGGLHEFVHHLQRLHALSADAVGVFE